MDHRGAGMALTGDYPGIFIYVRPEVTSKTKQGKKNEDQKESDKIVEDEKNEKNDGKSKTDTRRWLVFLSDERGMKDTHNHPKPVESKIDTKVFYS